MKKLSYCPETRQTQELLCNSRHCKIQPRFCLKCFKDRNGCYLKHSQQHPFEQTYLTQNQYSQLVQQLKFPSISPSCFDNIAKYFKILEQSLVALREEFKLTLITIEQPFLKSLATKLQLKKQPLLSTGKQLHQLSKALEEQSHRRRETESRSIVEEANRMCTTLNDQLSSFKNIIVNKKITLLMHEGPQIDESKEHRVHPHSGKLDTEQQDILDASFGRHYRAGKSSIAEQTGLGFIKTQSNNNSHEYPASNSLASSYHSGAHFSMNGTFDQKQFRNGEFACSIRSSYSSSKSSQVVKYLDVPRPISPNKQRKFSSSDRVSETNRWTQKYAGSPLLRTIDEIRLPLASSFHVEDAYNSGAQIIKPVSQFQQVKEVISPRLRLSNLENASVQIPQRSEQFKSVRYPLSDRVFKMESTRMAESKIESSCFVIDVIPEESPIMSRNQSGIMQGITAPNEVANV